MSKNTEGRYMDRFVFFTGLGGAAVLFAMILAGALLAVLIPTSNVGVGIILASAAIGIVLGLLAVVRIARRL